MDGFSSFRSTTKGVKAARCHVKKLEASMAATLVIQGIALKLTTVGIRLVNQSFQLPQKSISLSLLMVAGVMEVGTNCGNMSLPSLRMRQAFQ